MAYDPKKKRPKTNPIDSVVDELFGEEKPKKAAAKKSTSKTVAKKTATKKPAAKKPVKKAATKTTSAKKDTPAKKAQPKPAAQKIESSELPDNVRQLPVNNEPTPLVMQPNVWIATAATALLVLFVAKRRKKR